MFSRLLVLFIAALSWIQLAQPLLAQRVQFPSAAQNFTPTPTIPPTPAPALPNFDPYGNPLLGTPPPDVPYNLSPNVTPPVPATIQQPLNPNVTPGTAPLDVPPATPGVPQQGSSIFPSGFPYQWESSTYQYQNSDGTVARLQRLMQEISFEHTWIYRNGNAYDTLGINRTELAVTFGFPIFYNPDTPLLITPGFAFNWLDGPAVTADLPPRVYDAYLDGAWHPRLTDWLSADLGLRTGVWSDFNEVNSDSVRILGRGLGVLGLTPQFDVLVGVWYLDRNRIKLLPAGGVHWRPSTEWDMYLVFPNPKIRKRSIDIGSSQWWWYVAAEYGGGRWTIKRDPNGVAGDVRDDIDYNDIRLIFGLEWETLTQAHGHFEVGYVFDREIIYARSQTPPQLKVDDSIMLRAGVTF